MCPAFERESIEEIQTILDPVAQQQRTASSLRFRRNWCKLVQDLSNGRVEALVSMLIQVRFDKLKVLSGSEDIVMNILSE